MKFDLYTDVALRCDVPEHRLRRGDIVKLVDHHVAPNGTEGYSIEVFNALGDTIAVSPDITHARSELPEIQNVPDSRRSAYRAPGRRSGMIYVDDDVERAGREIEMIPQMCDCKT